MNRLFRLISQSAIFSFLALSFLLILLSCSAQNQAPLKATEGSAGLRPVTTDEALQDFAGLVNYFRTYYGPMEYKEDRFQFKFENLVAEAEIKLRAAKTEPEIMGQFVQFVAQFRDGHVGISFPANSSHVGKYSVPVFITPVADRVLIASVDTKRLPNSQLKVGDEIVAIDGAPPMNFLPTIMKYRSMGAPETDKHFVFKALSRDFFMTELKPTKNTVLLKVQRPDDSTYIEEVVWDVIPDSENPRQFVIDTRLGPQFIVPAMDEINNATGASLNVMGSPVPFFATPEVREKYTFRVVTADSEHRAKYALKDEEKPNIFAALYRYEGKNILLVRSYTFSHQDLSNETYMKGYKAILDQWEEFADVLVLDQTHNGGGSYCEDFFRLFITKQAGGFVQHLNVDRDWIIGLTSQWPAEIRMLGKGEDIAAALQAMGSVVEAAYDRGDKLTEPLPIMGGQKRVTSYADYTWKKPMLVLIDELAGSCSDAFPMLIKNNNVAKLFGQRTMGLGGNVVAMEPLPHSQAQLRLTRGLFTSFREDGQYSPSVLVENNGVQPDYPYEHNVEDFRAGFVGYVGAFSKKALEQIKSENPKAAEPQ